MFRKLTLTFSYAAAGCLRNRLVLAPMAGISDAPFRRIVWENGAGMLYSEMISAAGLVYDNRATLKMLRSCAASEPVNVQIYGANPLTMAKAARICEDFGVSMLDINMGCPVKKVFKEKAGAALMSDILRCREIVRHVRMAVNIPLSVKIRSGINETMINAVEVARVVEEEGADLITVHPRTGSQQFKGMADWSLIASVKQAVHIPVTGNGDVTSANDALRMLRETGCDMVMIGRASRGRPWLFKEILERSSLETEEKCDVILRHLHYMVNEYGKQYGIKKFRKHLLWYMKGFTGAAAVRHKSAIVSEIKEVTEILKAVI